MFGTDCFHCPYPQICKVLVVWCWHALSSLPDWKYSCSIDKMSGSMNFDEQATLIWQLVTESKREVENHLNIIHFRNLKRNQSELKCHTKTVWGCNSSLCGHIAVLKELLSFKLFILASSARKGKRGAMQVLVKQLLSGEAEVLANCQKPWVN